MKKNNSTLKTDWIPDLRLTIIKWCQEHIVHMWNQEASSWNMIHLLNLFSESLKWLVIFDWHNKFVIWIISI